MLRLGHVARCFGSNRAVDDVSLDVSRGEVVGLVGENGAGKTTLMRLVAGELVPDSGSIDRPARVELVHQHFMLVPDFTIAENLALAFEPRLRFARGRTRIDEAERTIAATGIALRDVRRKVRDLSVGEKSKLELIKAIATKPELLILDEPTSVLTPHESEELFRVVRTLAAAGTAIVFISHKLPEVLAIASRVVVMRRGRVVADTTAHGMTPSQLAEAMIGAQTRSGATHERHRGAVALRVHEATADVLDRATLEVAHGEIVAVVGVAGNGQSELAEVLHRIKPLRSGTIDAPVRVGAIPEDRTRDGLVAQMTIAENVSLGAPRWRRRESHARAARLIELFSIRAEGPSQRAGDLSGGNQQKVILARELDRKPELLIAAEPSRGLDIESTRFVHEQLRAAASEGVAILLMTSDLDEAFALADALHVIYRGRLSERLTPAEASGRVGELMAGVA